MMSKRKLYLEARKKYLQHIQKIQIIRDKIRKNNYRLTFEKIIEKHLDNMNKKYVKYGLKKCNNN